MYRRILVLPFVLAFAASTAYAEETPQWCDIPLPYSSSTLECDNSQYLSISISGGSDLSGNENPCTFIKSCRPAHKPPADLNLQCINSTNGFACNAWPQGETLGEFSYDWFVVGPLAVVKTGPSESPNQTLTCTGSGGGFVSVVVTSPFGLSSTHFMAVNCAH